MKQLLITILFAFSFALHAASPSFSSFNTDQFGTANNKVVVKESALLTNIVAKGTVTVNPGGASTPTFTSTVADSASAVAFRMNSSNTFATTGANLLEVQNHGTNWYYFQGGAPALTITKHPENVSLGYIQISVTEANSAIQQQIKDENGDAWIINLSQYDAGSGDVKQALGFASDNGEGTVYHMALDPGQDLEGTPYIFGTTATVSSGNLLKAQNNGTNKFTVDYLGGVTTGLPTGATNAHPFKIGAKSDAVGLVLVATNYIQIEVNGVLYKMALVQ